ncbi:hypothetical protein [Pseudomonas sessilinigenes]|uniref:Uncharacterized protein n=1 Tax=Pseudomonas sessilinigenes TaxID=658629 RepID=A0ABX8MJG2_9PSED|nr:hypothetical protein [Pseudomonas sessilinigenes]AZC26526.1 hypothetical protein C4K39_4881 [Pseudomonas sessilinigenes]QXH39468.1 hypothetical protein KSS89_25095 [Pseudomonas sessilinigenes]
MHHANDGSYHIFGVCHEPDSRLFVDYAVDDPGACEPRLLDFIRCSSDPALARWPARTQLASGDVFEIECVQDVSAAQEAVEFWRAYFRMLGMTVFEARHLVDRTGE